MPRGGARDGAGRKAGTTNQSTRELQAAVAASGETPLDYMLRVLRDPKIDHDRRDKLAIAAAPYVHARLASVEAKHDVSDALADLLKAVDGKTRGIPQGG